MRPAARAVLLCLAACAAHAEDESKSLPAGHHVGGIYIPRTTTIPDQSVSERRAAGGNTAAKELDNPRTTSNRGAPFEAVRQVGASVDRARSQIGNTFRQTDRMRQADTPKPGATTGGVPTAPEGVTGRSAVPPGEERSDPAPGEEPAGGASGGSRGGSAGGYTGGSEAGDETAGGGGAGGGGRAGGRAGGGGASARAGAVAKSGGLALGRAANVGAALNAERADSLPGGPDAAGLGAAGGPGAAAGPGGVGSFDVAGPFGGSGGGSGGATEADLASLAATGFKASFAAVGLKAEGGRVLRSDGSAASDADLEKLGRRILADPVALMKQPGYLDVVSRRQLAQLRKDIRSQPGDPAFTHIGVTEDKRDFVHTESCNPKLEKDCNAFIDDKYRKGDYVSPEDLDAIEAGLHLDDSEEEDSEGDEDEEGPAPASRSIFGSGLKGIADKLSGLFRGGGAGAGGSSTAAAGGDGVYVGGSSGRESAGPALRGRLLSSARRRERTRARLQRARLNKSLDAPPVHAPGSRTRTFSWLWLAPLGAGLLAFGFWRSRRDAA